MNTELDEPISLADLDHAPGSLAGEDATVSRESYIKVKDAFIAAQREKFLLEEENQRLKLKDATTETLNGLIKPMADKAFLFMCWYSICVGFLLVLTAAGGEKFELESSVLQFLVGSTAVTVIGLVGMVLTGVFVGARKG